MADNSLDLENILPGDNTNANPLSLLTSSPPDDSLSNDNTGIDATTELSSADGGNRGKAQDSLKNVDSLRLASGTGNCKSDAGDTRPGRRRLRRARDSCAFDYGEFVPSLPKNQPSREVPNRWSQPEQDKFLMPYYGQGIDSEKSPCENKGVKTVGNIPVCALDLDAVSAFPGIAGFETLSAIVNLKDWTPYTLPGCLKPEVPYCCSQVFQHATGVFDPSIIDTHLWSPTLEELIKPSSTHISDEEFLALSCVRVPDL